MNIIEAEAAKVTGWFGGHIPHRDQPASSGSPEQQEQPVTTPKRNIIADLAGVLTQVGNNKLISALASERLGELLTDTDVDHVTSIVRRIEDADHAAAAAQQHAQFTPHDDGTQQAG